MSQHTAPQPPVISLEWVEQQEAFHKRKLASLAVIKAALMDLVTPEANVGHDIPKVHAAEKLSLLDRLKEGNSKKKLILLALSANPMTTAEIVLHLINEGLKDSNQPNTSPQLSLYKGQGLVQLNNGVWSIAPPGRAWLDANKN